MATPAQPLARCVVEWIYQQAAELLQLLKKFLMTLINYIDAQILLLRAWLAQGDVLAKLEKQVYDKVQDIINQIREAMTSVPGGPLQEFCPEFYAYLLDPAIALFDKTVASLNVVRERYMGMLSYMDEIDQLLTYWDQTKANMVAMIDVLDDAIYRSLMGAAGAVP